MGYVVHVQYSPYSTARRYITLHTHRLGIYTEKCQVPLNPPVYCMRYDGMEYVGWDGMG